MARTEVDLTGWDAGDTTPGLLHRGVLSLTDDESTTGVADVRGMPIGRIRNESGSQIVVTLYEAGSADGTAISLYDQNGDAIPALTIPDDSSHAIPTDALLCIEYLILKLASGTAEVTLLMMR